MNINKLQEAIDQFDIKNFNREKKLNKILEKTCEWKKADYGQMGCPDYEYKTSCGINYDCDTTKIEKYCPNCGGKIIS